MLSRFFKFETMLTPILIRIFFPIILVFLAIASVAWGMDQSLSGERPFMIFLSIMIFFISALIFRIITEHIIVIFGIYERLDKQPRITP